MRFASSNVGKTKWGTEQTFGKLKQKPTNLGFKNPSLIHLVLTYLLHINYQLKLSVSVIWQCAAREKWKFFKRYI